VRIAQSLPYFEHCIIANNTSASGYGGAIYASLSGNLILRSCKVAHNTARYRGGGIWVGTSTNTPILECCEILGNSVMAAGAGLLTAVNCAASGPP
jgi:predicted outer membrane repeat protein